MSEKNSPLPLATPELDDMLALGAALNRASRDFDIAETPAVLIPPGWQLQLHPELRAEPHRIQGTVVLQTFDSYLAFIIEYGRSYSRTFVNQSTGLFATVLNYHQISMETKHIYPDFCDFRAVYAAPHSTEFLTWQAHSAKAMTQEAFAQFIEDNLPDIVDPAAAEMAEIARSLSANISVKFAKAIRLDNGETQLQYVEEIGGAAGAKGQLKIPQTIKLGLPLFVGGASYAVEARFRYRIKDGNLTMWYELIRPERLLRDAIDSMVQTVRDSTAIPVYYGTP